MLNNPLDQFYSKMTNFKIYRASSLISTQKGLKTVEKITNKKVIEFYPNVDVQVGDILILDNSTIEYHVIDLDTQIWQGNVSSIKAYYETTLSSKEKPTSNIFNINNAQNSIIGTQQSAILNNPAFNIDDLKQLIELYGNNDKQELNKLADELQHLLQKDNFHKSKLSKFSDLIAKHSWLPLAIAQVLAAYLQSH